MAKSILKCYMCEEPATSVEHVPAKCFFPKGHRENLITVPSCALHNNNTSKDDEYVRGIIVTSRGTNKLAVDHWRGAVQKGYLHNPKLFLKTFSIRKEKAFFHDRQRVDAVMIKIGYALYFHIYKKIWHSSPAPFYNSFHTDDGQTDMEFRLPNFNSIPYDIYEGSNQEVFKYQYFEADFNGQPNCYFKIIFYEGFEVLIFPVNDGNVNPLLILDISSKTI